MKRYNFCKIMIIAAVPITLFAQVENWVYRYNGPGNGWDDAISIVYGADGNIYAAGSSAGSGTESDFIVISLTPAGDTNWVYRYNSGDARSIVYGTDGNIYVAGSSSHIETSADFTVISLTTAGDTNWTYMYNGPGNDWDDAVSIVYGADGNIYAAGRSYGNGSSYDFTVISLTTAGDTNWVYRHNGPGNGYDETYSIVYGMDGNIYAAGYSTGSGTSYDFTVMSLTSAGDTNWVYRYNGPGNMDDEAYSIAYGADGNIYAAGYSTDGSSSYSAFTVISLTTAGDTNWIYQYDGPGNEYNSAFSIVYGGDGNIYAAGYSTGSGTFSDFTVISLTTAGDTNWLYSYNGPSGSEDGANSLVYGGDGNIYCAGNSFDDVTYGDFLVISLDPDLGVAEKNNIVRKDNYGATVFSGPLRLPKDKKCRVFDIAGSVVKPETIRPGIYFIQNEGKIIQKVVKVK